MADELTPNEVAALADELAGPAPADDGIADIVAKVDAQARAAEADEGEA